MTGGKPYREWWFHEDDNYSEASAAQSNYDSGYGSHKFKIKQFVEASAVKELEEKLQIAVEALEEEKNHCECKWPENSRMICGICKALEKLK